MNNLAFALRSMPCPTAIALKGITILLTSLFGGHLSLSGFGSGLFSSFRTIRSQFWLHRKSNESLAELQPLFDAVGGAKEVGVDMESFEYPVWLQDAPREWLRRQRQNKKIDFDSSYEDYDDEADDDEFESEIPLPPPPPKIVVIAAAAPPPLPPRRHLQSSTAAWTVTSGTQYCSLTSNGLCVTDGTGNYGNGERCTIEAQRALYATATSFTTEGYFDRISLAGTSYSGSTGPSNVAMSAGQTMTWYTDGSVIRAGFTICATDLPPLPSPPPAPPARCRHRRPRLSSAPQTGCRV